MRLSRDISIYTIVYKCQIKVNTSVLMLICLFREDCFPDGKSSPKITIHHSYSNLARR